MPLPSRPSTLPPRLVSCLLATAFLASGPVSARMPSADRPAVSDGRQPGGQESLWTFEADAQITGFGFASARHLFVSTKTDSSVLRTADGHTVWSTADLRECESQGSSLACRYFGDRARLELLPSTGLGLLAVENRVLLVSLLSGLTVFDSVERGLGRVRSYMKATEAGQLLLLSERDGGALALAGVRLDAGPTVWVSPLPIAKDFRWLSVLSDETAVAYGKDANGQRVLLAVDLGAGDVAWNRADLLGKDAAKTPALARTRDDALLLHVSKDGPMLVDRGGDLVWRAEALSGEDPSAFLYDLDGTEHRPADRVYLFQDGRVHAVNALDGTGFWTYKPPRRPDRVIDHARGLLFVSDSEVQLLNVHTGSPAWEAPATLPGASGSLLIHGDSLYWAGPDEVAVVDTRTGRVRSIAAYESDADDTGPDVIEIVNGEVLLLFGHQIARYRADGTELFRRSYRPSGPSGWSRLGRFALGATLGSQEGIYRALYAHYAASVNTERFYYVYFEDRDGIDAQRFGLARIDKVTGSEERLWINERSPEYLLDAANGWTFYRAGERSIHAVRF